MQSDKGTYVQQRYVGGHGLNVQSVVRLSCHDVSGGLITLFILYLLTRSREIIRLFFLKNN